MQNKYPCAKVFHDLWRTEKRMGIYTELPKRKRSTTGTSHRILSCATIDVAGKLELQFLLVIL